MLNVDWTFSIGLHADEELVARKRGGEGDFDGFVVAGSGGDLAGGGVFGPGDEVR